MELEQLSIEVQAEYAIMCLNLLLVIYITYLIPLFLVFYIYFTVKSAMRRGPLISVSLSALSIPSYFFLYLSLYLSNSNLILLESIFPFPFLFI